jgi:alkylation response protein AidB-like acyl-CoA dehydrogenase
MGAIGAIMKYGTEQQRRLAAGLVLGGDKPAICITEPEAGSAATEMTTRAVKQGDSYVINGKKHWITGAGVSKLHLIFARVMADGKDQGIGGFIAVRGESEGLVLGEREPAMGIRGIPEGEIILRDLKVHESMMLDPPGGLRTSFAKLMEAYNAQRLGAATVALGLAAGANDLAVQYAKDRHQFGRPIAEFQGLQWMLADMAIALSAGRALIHKAAAREGFPDMMEAAQAKIFVSDMAIKVTNDALQIFGSAGYSRRRPLERMARDARMFTISGGTAQVLRNQVAAKILGRKLPQTRDGYLKLAQGPGLAAAD